MKKIFRILSIITISLFGIFWIISKFDFSPSFNTIHFQAGLVVVYFAVRIRYYNLEIKDKNEEIKRLKKKLKEDKKIETNATEKI